MPRGRPGVGKCSTLGSATISNALPPGLKHEQMAV